MNREQQGWADTIQKYGHTRNNKRKDKTDTVVQGRERMKSKKNNNINIVGERCDKRVQDSIKKIYDFLKK